jgi:copper resistance protein B
MRTSPVIGAVAAIVLATSAQAQNQVRQPGLDAMADMHKPGLYHSFTLETDLSRQNDETTGTWDLDGWAGGDINRLWLKSEGEITGGKTQKAELWALYSRNVATYWDAQVGIREDFKPSLPAVPGLPAPKAHTYLAAGVAGLAPYFFETEAHLFVRDDGAISARLRQENQWLVTQRLILQPRLELNLNGKEDPALGLGTGLTDASLGLQARYEFRREFAPYLDLTYDQKFGRTADYARMRGEKPTETRLSVGIRWMF